MWGVVGVGPAVERLLGHIRFLAVYLLSAIGGSVLYYYLQPYGFAAGASGAIFGLFGAWFVVSRKLRLDSRPIIVLIAINLGLSFAYTRIAWQPHVGGLIIGAPLTAAYPYSPRNNPLSIPLAAAITIEALPAVAAR